jgi:hypothetical protein
MLKNILELHTLVLASSFFNMSQPRVCHYNITREKIFSLRGLYRKITEKSIHIRHRS